jgi:beta-lactamase regulating signal transducer with metallopeptidase domain
MTSDLFVLTLLRAQIALSLGLLLTMTLRAPMRRLVGARLAYRLWVLGPAAALTSIFPTLAEFIRQEFLVRQGNLPGPVSTVFRIFTENAVWAASAQPLLCTWSIGAVTLGLLFLRSEVRFRRLAGLGLAGPAIVGVAAPRLVVPYDFKLRFSIQERSFIRPHERAHMQRRDTLTNLFIAVMQMLGWFNPLVHIAAHQLRLDQELACDAHVVDGRPHDRRAYAEALIKVQLTQQSVGFGCAWAPSGRHPLELRLTTLVQAEPSLRRHVAGAAAIVVLGVILSAAVWSFEPRNGSSPVASPYSTGTPSSPLQ